MLFHSQLLERLAAIPGVEAACVLNDIPGLELAWQTDINLEINGEYLRINAGELVNVDWGIVTSDSFKTMSIPIKQGRSFTAQEVAQGSPIMLVDEQLAHRFWPEGDALASTLITTAPHTY